MFILNIKIPQKEIHTLCKMMMFEQTQPKRLRKQLKWTKMSRKAHKGKDGKSRFVLISAF